jgi:hypothetical protein
MDDFTQFDAFERCREFARCVGKHLSRGAFSKDPVLTTALRPLATERARETANAERRPGPER